MAQDQSQEKAEEPECAGPIYKREELSRRAKITSKPPAAYTDKARAKNVTGRVLLDVILCSSGKVTDIKVIKGLPHGMTEKTIEAAKQAKFIPAEKDGQPASQRAVFEYDFSMLGGTGAVHAVYRSRL